MGNCLINRSSSSSPVPLAKMDGINCCCDGTIESASYATISPPASPIKPDGDDAIDAKQNEHDLHAPPQHDSRSLNNDIDYNMKSSASSSIMEQEREDGQTKLRELVISGANAGDIDWKSIIALAEDLHRKEQQLLKSYKDKRLGSADNKRPGRINISRRQAFFEKRRRQRELSRRRKLESVGSFSVNLLKYGVEDERCVQREEKSSSPREEAICGNVSASIDNEYTAMDDDDDFDDELHVFEDDNLAVLDHHILSCESSTRSHCQAKCTFDRPSTPSPYTQSNPVDMSTMEGSFEGCFFNSSNRDDLSDSSSSCSKSSQVGAWDLMTIVEDTTVANW